MKKREIVRKAKDFDNIIQSGSKIKNKYFNIFYKEDKIVEPLFGIAVSKKHGNAVVRNKMRRQIRTILDNNKNSFKNNRKYIIMIKESGINLSYQDKEKFLLELTEEKK